MIIDPHIRNSSMRILEKSHFRIITTAGILLLNIRIIRCTFRVIPTVLGGMRSGTIFPSWMRRNYKISRTYLDFPRNSPRPNEFLRVYLLARRNRVHAIQNDSRTQKLQVTYLREILYIELH